MVDIDFTMYNIAVMIVIGYTISGWLVPLGIKINYGRIKGTLFKFEFPPKIGWLLMEIPNLIWAGYFIFVVGDRVGLGYMLFLVHYINRTLIYPLTLKTTNKMPIEIVVTGASFTFSNGYLQGINNEKI